MLMSCIYYVLGTCILIELIYIIYQQKKIVDNKKECEKQKNCCYIYMDFVEVITKWMILKKDGFSLASFFEKNNYKKIAIYGYSNLGECLYNDLSDSGIEIAYIIDKKAKELYAECPIYLPDDELPIVDIIVITTADHLVDEIEQLIAEKNGCKTITLKEVIARV